MASSWLQIHHRTELLLHQKFLEIAFGANLDLFANVSLDGIILPEEAADASRINALYQAFFLRDLRENHGRADRVWRLMMNEAFPELIGMDLVRSLTYLTLVTWRWRRSSHRRCFQFIEYFCGEGNLSKALLRINRRGIPFDIRLNPDHNFLTPSGIRLAILSLMMTAENALIWFGTPCSSWSIICLVWSRRYEENFFLGDESYEFVRIGNRLMDFTALLYLFSFCISNFVVLEQPRDSVLPKCTSMKLVLNFSCSGRVSTYGAAFGAGSLKPWQLWSTNSRILALERRRPDISTSSLMVHSESGRFSGNRDLIRASEIYPPGFGLAVAEMVQGGASHHI